MQVQLQWKAIPQQAPLEHKRGKGILPTIDNATIALRSSGVIIRRQHSVLSWMEQWRIEQGYQAPKCTATVEVLHAVTSVQCHYMICAVVLLRALACNVP